jgi:hypothetical protein
MFVAVWGESFTGRESGVIGVYASRPEAQRAADDWMRANRHNSGLGAWVRLA